MKRLIVGVILCLCAVMVSGQPLRSVEKGYYRQPIEGTLLLSANFAEARTDHLHSGIDIKVGGVEGKPLYAVADGYVSRIGVAPSGFGRVLYIAHPNGTTSVYAHQQKFMPEIENYVASERYRLKIHRVDLYLAANKFPVKKGQLIGYAGNSGRSFGPHLHFEIRESASQRILNIPKMGIYDMTDNLAPTIAKLHYIGVDVLDGVAVDSPVKTFSVVSSKGNIYSLAESVRIELPERGYFVLEATDRKNNTDNTMGIYSVRMSMDTNPIFAFHLNSFLFSEQRYVNSLSHYAMQKGSRNELLRLAVQTNNKLPIYSEVKNRGYIILPDSDTHSIEIEAADDNGNISKLIFAVRKRTEDSAIATHVLPEGIPVDCTRTFSRSVDGATVSIPAGSLYESIFYTQSLSEPAARADTRYSPIHTIHTNTTPLHSSISLKIKATKEIPQRHHSKACLVKISGDGASYQYAGGSYADGSVTASVRSFGDYAVVVDSIPPTLTSSFTNGANLRTAKTLSFTFADNLSGVASFTANIDGKWIAFEQRGSTITHHFDPSRIAYNGTTHEVVLSATDSKGNTASIKRSFIR